MMRSRSRAPRHGVRHWLISLSALFALSAGLAGPLSGCSADASDACSTGSEGCSCYDNGTCDGSGDSQLVCSAGICTQPLCTIGSEHCACFKNFTCSTGLVCQPDPSGPHCERSCPDGDVGCHCLPGDKCHGDGDLFCSDGVCDSRSCPIGSNGCHCAADGSCGDGLECIGQMCHESGVPLTPPANPKCYTPCRADLPVGGTKVRPCSEEGLMVGCVGDKVCVNGSCVSSKRSGDKPEPSACTTDTDCPDFQTCIAGGCYSNCDKDTDCSSERRCHRHVCRRTCTTDKESCASGSHCESDDGKTGVCMPDGGQSGDAPTTVTGSFSLSDTSLAFTNVRVQRSITITNDSPQTLEFTVKKLRHMYVDDDGVHNVTNGALAWLSIGEFGHATKKPESTFLVEGNGGQKRIVFLGAGDAGIPQWSGVVEISNENIGTKKVTLTYAEVPEGKWTGKAYYFSDFGSKNLDTWVAAKDKNLPPADYQHVLSQVGNAFVQKWGMFRKGWLTYAELSAALNATISGSWSSKAAQQVCPWPQGACFLYDNPNGYVEYTSNRFSVPVPSGALPMPYSMNLRMPPGSTDPTVYAGRIDTNDALQIQGFPAVSMKFAGDPADPKMCSAVSNDGMCILTVKSLRAIAYTGGRLQRKTAGESCPSEDYQPNQTPWLIPGFTAFTSEQAGKRYSYDCRTKTAPFGTSASGEDLTTLNINLALSNPVPNGKLLTRKLELIDGAMVNRKHLLLLFRERSSLELGRGQVAPMNSYGVMVLDRRPTNLEDKDYQGWEVQSPPVAPANALNVSCSPDLVTKILGSDPLNKQTANRMARGVLSGQASSSPPAPIPADSNESVHYLCVDTGEIDGGHVNDPGYPHACPWGSKVVYFTRKVRDANGNVMASCDEPVGLLSCQHDGSCESVLKSWEAHGRCDLRMAPMWRCAAPNTVYCDDDRYDLRNGKTFYAQSADAPVFLPIENSIEEAFRYKVRFTNRNGKSVGFAPQICVPDSNAVPYCYDPKEIEKIQDRVDCVLSLFTDYHDSLSVTERERLRDYLRRNFSRDPEQGRDGFERLDAELLIMLGDEALTKSFTSRFDLAGQILHSFEGSKLEPGGIDLSGQAGYEMYTLYQAVEYYQMALDRFYRFSPYLWESLAYNATDPQRNFVTQQTASEYLNRLIRASSQKAAALGQIAKRYQSFHRPDLARIVVQRAYGAAYLESMLLSQFMLKVVGVSSPTKRAQIRALVDKASRTYRVALSDMRGVYESITEETTFFGFPPEYVPFPALEPGDNNAFEKMFAIAQQKVNVALAHEDDALASGREFDTDEASFQSELVKIQQSYENDLGDMCGTFVAADGNVYPAIPKYAHLHPIGKLVPNPCGLLGNGEIHEDMADLKTATLDLQIAISNYRAHLAQIEIERQRVNKYCNANLTYADMMLGRANKRESLLKRRLNWETVNEVAERTMDYASQAVDGVDCLTIIGLANGTNCIQKGIAWGIYQAVRVASLGTIIGARVHMRQLDKQMRDHDRDTAYLETVQDCQYAKIDSEAQVATLATETEALALEVAKANYNVLTVESRIDAAYQKSQRLIDQEQDALDMAINVEAAHNDPNVRIYKNENIITADQAFQAALQSVYKATKVFEYYTSQSYAAKDQLFLIRMAGHGDYNLESYMWGLQDAYLSFQEQYGNPEARIAILSLKNDILKIPRVDDNYDVYSEKQRTDLFRKAFADNSLRDAHGYIVAPFNTALRNLSPLTRNHKILYVEAELVGTDLGDRQGRIYLRQRGTGVVRGVDGDQQFFGFPERTSVVNTFFNGERFFQFSNDDVFKSYRLRDRPLVNTRWEFVFNPVSETVNQDINMNGLSDVRIYVYYTDFTAL